MKKIWIFLLSLIICSCTHLTAGERQQKMALKAQGITVDHPRDNWEKPANSGAAAILNILPGFGNFYLAAGNGGDSTHWLYGTLNLLMWPLSVVWAIPEAAIDANVINERELIYHYYYEKGVNNIYQPTQRNLKVQYIDSERGNYRRY